MAGLSDKQRRFVAEYMVDLNATQAAIRTGYKRGSAKVHGHRLLTNANVREEIERRGKAKLTQLELTVERVLQEFAKVAFGNMLDYVHPQPDGSVRVDFSELTRDQAGVIQSIETEEWMDRTGEVDEGKKPVYERVRKVKFRLHDKLSALTSLGRYLKIFDGEVDSGDRLDQLVAALKRPPYKPTPVQ
jgi:phage terminase small subunit